jgi:D-alanyl-D-alanine carboxypeptidase
VAGLAAAAVMTASPAGATLEPLPGPAAVPAAVRDAGPLRVNAWGGGLVDARTGVVVWGRDFGVARPMGSITKVMTALLVIGAGDLGREIKVTKGAIRTGNTDAAGNCFLFEARRGRRTLVGVLLHVNPTRNGAALFTAARHLLNWGYQRI